MRYRIHAGTVITMDDQGHIYQPGQVTWDDENITTVGGPESDLTPVDHHLHVPEGLVLPGFYNGHNHAAMTLFRGLADDSPLFEWLQHHIWPREARLTAEDIYLGTMVGIAEMIRSGTVGFADMYFEVDAVARAVAESGIRGWISRGLIGDQDPGGEKLDESVAFAQKWRGQAQGRVVPMLGPHAPYTCSPEYLRRVAEAARTHDLGIHIHLAESRSEIDQMLSRYGRTPIALASEAGIFQSRTLIAHGVHIDAADLTYLEGIQGGIVSCPVSNAKLGNGILPYSLLEKAGIAVGLGTDGAASTNTLDMFEEMKAMAWMQKLRDHRPDTFKAYDALVAATRASARILGFPGGQLVAGGPADLIVVATQSAHMTPQWDPVANLVYAGHGGDVRYTVVAGRILLADGVITAFDENALLAEARRWRQMFES